MVFQLYSPQKLCLNAFIHFVKSSDLGPELFLKLESSKQPLFHLVSLINRSQLPFSCCVSFTVIAVVVSLQSCLCQLCVTEKEKITDPFFKFFTLTVHWLVAMYATLFMYLHVASLKSCLRASSPKNQKCIVFFLMKADAVGSSTTKNLNLGSTFSVQYRVSPHCLCQQIWVLLDYFVM